MTVFTSVAVASSLVRSVDVGAFSIQGKVQVPDAVAGDQIVLFTAPHAMRVIYSTLKVPAGMGAAATVQARRNRPGAVIGMTQPSTANAFSVITSHSSGATDLQAGDVVELIVSGGPLTSGLIEYDFLAQRA